MTTGVIVASIAAPILALSSTAGARWVGRWFGRALKASMEDAVTFIVKPLLDHLAQAIDALRAAVDSKQAEVDTRLNVLETRVARVEAALTIDQPQAQGG